MNILTVLLVGLISGFLAGKIVEGHGFGTLGDVCIGIVGAFIGSWLFGSFGAVPYDLLGSILVSTGGAVVLLFVAHLFHATTHRHKTI